METTKKKKKKDNLPLMGEDEGRSRELLKWSSDTKYSFLFLLLAYFSIMMIKIMCKTKTQ
jgi:hypothetical protein